MTTGGGIDSADTPGGCWVHFSAIVSQGYRSLKLGGQGTFTYEDSGQDGFGCRAVQVWPPGTSSEAPLPPAENGPSAAYRSSLTVQWPDEGVTKGDPSRGREG